MRRIAIMAAIVLPVVIIMAFSSAAFAATAPHGGYSASTDFCVQCHDIHEAQGDYVLTRAATVTATCGTCHGVFGAASPASATWTNTPPDFGGTNPTASTKTAYEVNMSTKTAAQMDAVPGHSLGVMYGGTVVRSSDSIPGGSANLKIMTSGQYGGPVAGTGIYSGQAASSKEGTKGLNCASCHTPHGSFGQMLAGSKLLSSKPNHSATAVTTTYDFCATCHDKRDNVGAEKNHPAQYCLLCHGNKTGESDFPHTSSNKRLLIKEPDDLCVGCHSSGTLP